MENLKHTKGEWEITPNKLLIVKSGTLDIISDCDTTDVETSLTKSESEANAKLIAAAPNLLEALIEARKHMTAHIPEHIFDLIDNAINKATK